MSSVQGATQTAHEDHVPSESFEDDLKPILLGSDQTMKAEEDEDESLDVDNAEMEEESPRKGKRGPGRPRLPRGQGRDSHKEKVRIRSLFSVFLILFQQKSA